MIFFPGIFDETFYLKYKSFFNNTTIQKFEVSIFSLFYKLRLLFNKDVLN